MSTTQEDYHFQQAELLLADFEWEAAGRRFREEHQSPNFEK